MNNKYVIYVGMNDKELLKQVINNKDFINIINNTMIKYNIEGFSTIKSNGYFTNKDKKTTIEKSIKIEIISDINIYDKLKLVVRKLKELLNQECIGLEKLITNVEWL